MVSSSTSSKRLRAVAERLGSSSPETTARTRHVSKNNRRLLSVRDGSRQFNGIPRPNPPVVTTAVLHYPPRQRPRKTKSRTTIIEQVEGVGRLGLPRSLSAPIKDSRRDEALALPHAFLPPEHAPPSPHRPPPPARDREPGGPRAS